MAAIVGKPVEPWERGRYAFFGQEGELLGRAEHVTGLDEALEVAAGREFRNFPDIYIEGLDRDLERWVFEHAKSPREKCDFLVRDNQRKRWVRLRGAFVRKGGGPSCVWVINGAEIADGPY
jgi:hypothetical protein